MAEYPAADIDGVLWRRITQVLWVGRRDGRHIGMIEHGRSYVATDGEGIEQGRFRDLAAAQAFFAARAV